MTHLKKANLQEIEQAYKYDHNYPESLTMFIFDDIYIPRYDISFQKDEEVTVFPSFVPFHMDIIKKDGTCITVNETWMNNHLTSK